MRQEIILAWLNALIKEWKRAYMMRTLSEPCGAEFATWIGFDGDMKFHLDCKNGKYGIDDIAFCADAEIKVSHFDRNLERHSFMYKGFEFFALVRKETE